MQNRSIRVNAIRDGSPSRIRKVLLISLGMTTRPNSSILLTIPVALTMSCASLMLFSHRFSMEGQIMRMDGAGRFGKEREFDPFSAFVQSIAMIFPSVIRTNTQFSSISYYFYLLQEFRFETAMFSRLTFALYNINGIRIIWFMVSARRV